MVPLFDHFLWSGPLLPFGLSVLILMLLGFSVRPLASMGLRLAPGLGPSYGAAAAAGGGALLLMNAAGFLLFVFPMTTQICATLSLALAAWGAMVFVGVRKFGSSFLAPFFPSGAPLLLAPLLVLIELVSYCARPLSLGLRLAANLTAGHLLMAIVGGFGFQFLLMGPFAGMVGSVLLIAILCLEVAVLFIQAYVFSLLVCIYMEDSINLH
tara:strand:+ start:271 stop:903 length:633 start_codon:yes stop_codon:yes gene_type:complete